MLPQIETEWTDPRAKEAYDYLVGEVEKVMTPPANLPPDRYYSWRRGAEEKSHWLRNEALKVYTMFTKRAAIVDADSAKIVAYY